ncbi:sugar ABC transporter substrate-binding protein [Candidatus Dojkabacteria bacterium]|uniref:Sugar ABC transporter substrate-binding protein n=1 Tax=Candidatus Dojkabacteria bacterium TaxID=2099670 RepID=A0A955KUW1_9BACT|nr:sugar ABC transporter substrate-binding protein [Candidatus Dojkabacteria bacterium]MCB9790841.1 sugar ABC transporter substrate-binding protein [Candidatus Nomurabacteria bacterium]
MDKNKKVLLIAGVGMVLVLGLLLLISLTRKNSNTDNSTTGGTAGQTTNSGQSVTLEYWGLWEPEGVMQPLIDQYEQQNPSVKIVYVQKSFTQYEENVYTRLKQGTTSDSPSPDILRINNTWLSKFQPYLYPLPQDIMSASDYQSTFYPTAVSDLTGTDFGIYAIPLEVDGLALFYNKELLDQQGIQTPPSDWDSIIDLSKKLTKKDSSGNITQAGIAMGASENITHSADIFSMLLLQNGATIINDTNTVVDITSSRAITALDFYTDFVKVHEVWSPDLANDLEMFYSGKLAMMLAPSWRSFDIINANSSIEFGVAPAPIISDQKMYYSMYWAEAVSKDSENPTEAWKFVKFLSEQSQLKAFHGNSVQIAGRAFGEPYSRQDMSGLLQSNPYAGAIIQMAPDMKAWKMGEQAFVEQSFRDAITNAVVNGQTSADALSTAQKDINDKLASSVQ